MRQCFGRRGVLAKRSRAKWRHCVGQRKPKPPFKKTCHVRVQGAASAMKTEFLSLLAFMKKLTVRILAILTLAAGVAAAAAQSSLYFDINAKDYSLNAQFNNPPSVISAAGLPTPVLTDLEPMLQGAIGTDGSGKIDGVQYARVYFGGAANHTNNYATFVVGVTGSIRTKGTASRTQRAMERERVGEELARILASEITRA